MPSRLAAIRRARRRIAAAVAATFILAWGVVAFDGSKGVTTTATAATPLTATPYPTATSSSSSSGALTTRQS